MHQIYLYTAADVASDAAALDRLIASRQCNIPQLDVRIVLWEDSGHCRLHKDHPEEYQEAIDQALDAAVTRATQH